MCAARLREVGAGARHRRREPLYAEYKRRAAELPDPRPGDPYFEVGTGTGDDALAFAARFGTAVVGVDSSKVMVEEAQRRGLTDAVVTDVLALPFEDDSFEGAWSDRTSQHLSERMLIQSSVFHSPPRSGRTNRTFGYPGRTPQS
jgi:hypothetical protein